jgi:chemotaxis-related protein WspD
MKPAMLHSALVFRIADEWLALPTAALRQVDDVRPIHSLPHRRNRVVLGLVNIRGTLTVAASLGELLRLDRPVNVHETGHGSRNHYARMLVAAHRGEPVAFPVDEVEGVLRFAATALMSVPTTLAHASASHARGVLAWRDTTNGAACRCSSCFARRRKRRRGCCRTGCSRSRTPRRTHRRSKPACVPRIR